ncbi:MAG: hypothetical protein HDT27_06265 [Subdoligranulum sp.]|nr:hypothetical protein [Subdoligranulum sp.]
MDVVEYKQADICGFPAQTCLGHWGGEDASPLHSANHGWPEVLPKPAIKVFMNIIAFCEKL